MLSKCLLTIFNRIASVQKVVNHHSQLFCRLALRSLRPLRELTFVFLFAFFRVIRGQIASFRALRFAGGYFLFSFLSCFSGASLLLVTIYRTPHPQNSLFCL